MKLKLYEKFSSWTHFDNIWVYADTHFNDPACLLIDKNWPTAEEHLKRINAKVNKNDLLILLGDVGDISYVSGINGTKILITGNHDKDTSNYRRNCSLRCLGTVKELDFDNKQNRIQLIKNIALNCFSEKLEVHLDSDGIERVYVEYDNRLFDEIFDGPVFINKKILLSHEPINIPFGYNIHGHNQEASIINKNYASFNVCANAVNFEPQRLDKLIENHKVTDIHRLVIENAKKEKTNRININ